MTQHLYPFLFLILFTAYVCPSITTEKNNDAVILVHGAWTGEWIWSEIKSTLVTKGYQVYAPTLSGMGERQNESLKEITLIDHSLEIASLLMDIKADHVILVGHSYGGLVISEVAAIMPEKVSKLIFLDALVPFEGKSGAEVIGLPFTSPKEAEQILGEQWWKMEQKFDDDRFSNFHPTGTFFHKTDFRLVLDSDIPLVYVWFTESVHSPLSVIAAELQGDERWQFYTLNMAHYDILHRPDEVLECLLEIISNDL